MQAVSSGSGPSIEDPRGYGKNDSTVWPHRTQTEAEGWPPTWSAGGDGDGRR